MTEHPGRKTVLFLVLVFAASSLLAENIKNWSAPATWKPTAASGVHTMTDVTNALPFIGLVPCRIVDTRGNGAPITGGIYAASELRNYAVAGICGIPSGARALSLNITVTGPGQTGAGFLLAFPTGSGAPPVSSLNWDHAPATVGNAAVVPTNGSTSISINVSGPTHVIIDINGYYPDGTSTLLLNPGLHFEVAGNSVPPFGIINGRNNSTATNARGILGISQDLSVNTTTWTHAAIRGESITGNGVIGLTNGGGNCGVIGTRYDAGGAIVTSGLVGCTHGLDYTGGLAGTGTKSFVEPHPTDASKLIRYTSLEGPEAGTYFRGTATTVDGFAVITVPETFRWVTDPDGLTVQLTPTGREFALMRVESADLNTVVVRSSVDSTTFHFMVNGVRRAYKDVDVIIDNYLLKPTGPNDVMPSGLSAVEKARLIKNGTYNEDGTANLQTAERVGWAAAWRERDEQAKESATRPFTPSPDRP